MLEHLGLLPALVWLADESSTLFGIDTDVKTVGAPRRLPAEPELVLFRIAQEALSNVKKHSKATRAMLKVEFARERVKLEVTDNGRGFEVPATFADLAGMAKLGLMGMQERARLLHGTFSVTSETGKGTTVAAEVRG